MDFETLKLHPKVQKGVEAQGFTEPTPIQQESIPPLLEGHDLLGLAQTGTGKTAAFALPILQRLMKGARGVTRALVVAPTRELAEQICDTFLALGKKTGLKAVTVYGGVGITPQIERLAKGPEIVVACPGRLLDHISRKTIKLKRIEVLVLDEADRMFDMGFMPEVRRIIRHLPLQQKRQSMLFSATMPKEVSHLVDEVLADYVKVQIDRISPAETVGHALYPVTDKKKIELLYKLLYKSDADSVLVFTRTKHRAERVSKKLKQAGFTAASLQGNLSQTRRNAALSGFRDGTFQILVATDIAARGIDVSSISHVINYDVPDTVDAYIHRIGRTGRAAKTGDAFTMVTNMDSQMVRAIEKALGSRIERVLLEDFNYGEPEENQRQNKARHFHKKRQGDRGKKQGGPGSQVDGKGAGASPKPQKSKSGTRQGGKASGGPDSTPSSKPARRRPSRRRSGGGGGNSRPKGAEG